MITSWQRYAKDHPRVVDVVVIVQLHGAVALGSTFTTAADSPTNGSLGLGVLLGGIACVALLWHRSHPRTVVAVTAICASTTGAAGYLLTPLLLAPVMAALYWLAVHTDRRTARVHGLAVTALLVTTAMLFDPYGQPLALKTIGPAAWVVLPIAWGTASRLRSAYLEAVQARAEHAREEEARHRVAEERMRIARELHDVVAHHMALANALAGTAAHLAASRPEQTERILADLVGTTSTALRELKATVGLLRRPDDSEAPLEPAPGLGRLIELATAFASAGLTVDIVTEGERRPLTPGVDLTAFRIVQEALTNVTKHASARAAQVTLTYTHDRLTVTVTDDGSGDTPVAPSPSGGFGLIGMRERAQSVGGRVRTGPRPEGGFSVTAELPIHL